jgi:hypothetical protein
LLMSILSNFLRSEGNSPYLWLLTNLQFLFYKVVHKSIATFKRFLDIRMGLLGAVFMGVLVSLINIDYGLWPALLAAGRQAMYTFFFGALFVRMAENIAINKEERYLAIFLGGFIPALLTTILTYCLHAFRGTPEPLYSSIPTFLLGLMSFSTWSYLKHRSAFSQDINE